MSDDISTQYTKYLNKKCGRHGYYMAAREKVDVISPKNYGIFIQNRRKEKR